MSVENENNRDPRVRLIREKYFSIRPRPLERWLWSQGVPASAERVFWLHWQEGVQRGDWCSEIPLRRVARECNLDVSTVTRAYQLLAKMGCIRRTDPGRDPANPFQQATALTEVRLPRELLAELDRHPNRRYNSRKTEDIETERALGANAAQPVSETVTSTESASAEYSNPQSSNPLAGLRGRDRVRALSQLTDAMSANEREAYQQAMRMHRASMTFDTESKLTEKGRAMVLQVLASMAAAPAPTDSKGSAATVGVEPRRRKLPLFELARLKRDIQIASSSTQGGPELLRQVMWSVEAGALRRFSARHAINIALKKIREGTWTRPHRMPPNWVPALSAVADAGTCRAA